MSCYIGYLAGTVRGTNIVVCGNGVGYVVHTPAGLEDGTKVELHVTTVVREDAITLYGFATEIDQQVFAALLKIPGVGPAVALALLRDVGVAGIAAAVEAGDHRALTRARGVGAKAAEKICSMVNLPGGIDVTADDDLVVVREIVNALENLGYDTGQATDAARAVQAEIPAESEPAKIARALSWLRSAA